LILCLSIFGKTIKNISEAKTSQKMSLLRFIILSMSLVSLYNQIIPNIDTRGIEAKIAPNNDVFFDISDTTKTKTVVMINLTI
jgi:hypothetical protein